MENENEQAYTSGWEPTFYFNSNNNGKYLR